jgi:hypothetical protein
LAPGSIKDYSGKVCGLFEETKKTRANDYRAIQIGQMPWLDYIFIKNPLKNLFGGGSTGAAARFARSLHANISARDIMIVAPYMAPCEEYVGQLELMGKSAGLADIRVRTVDGVRGGEAPVVILDMTITDRLGFLTKPNRLNVALSRERVRCMFW